MRSEYRGIRLGRYGTMPEGKNGKPVPAAIVGLGFGDEGKGMAVAHEVGRSRACGLDAMVVRFNGGPQAAHNVRVVDRDGNIRHHTHAQFGSGTLLGARIIPEGYQIGIITQTPGGFMMFGFAMALLIYCLGKKGKKFDPRIGCDGKCGNCALGCENAITDIVPEDAKETVKEAK